MSITLSAGAHVVICKIPISGNSSALTDWIGREKFYVFFAAKNIPNVHFLFSAEKKGFWEKCFLSFQFVGEHQVVFIGPMCTWGPIIG